MYGDVNDKYLLVNVLLVHLVASGGGWGEQRYQSYISKYCITPLYFKIYPEQLMGA